MTHHHPIDGQPPPWSDHDATGSPPPSPDPAARAPATDHRSGPSLGPATDAPELPTLGPDSSVREIARAAREAFLGADLIRSGPTLWPFGQRARTRRERNQQVIEQARLRRAQFRQAFDAPPAAAPRPARRRPIGRRTNRIVIAGLAGLALAVAAAAVWLGRPEPRPVTQPAPASSTTSPLALSSTTATTPGSTSGSAAVPAQPPIPSGGVAPITPRPHPTVNPSTVVVVDPPVGDPTPNELATPESAVRAWLARKCPFDYRQPVGTAERQARPAMTDAGWNTVDPSDDARVRASWDRTVAARESGRCAAPTALVSPEAPRSPTTAIVIGAATRLVTPEGGQPYVEHLTEVRLVRRGTDGLWRVDLPTEGG
jgi:hypothetical protein